MTKFAFITLATSNEYAKSALVLNRTIKNSDTKAESWILIPLENYISPSLINTLEQKFDKLIKVDLLKFQNSSHLLRPELAVTLTKLHVFSLDLEVGVFLDSDTMLLSNSDELFKKLGDEQVAAAPEFAWPDCFNTGVFVFKPSKIIFDSLVLASQESFDGGDQGVLNNYFKSWKKLSVNYNLPLGKFAEENSKFSTGYGFSAAFKRFGGLNVKIVHFMGDGINKPWSSSKNLSNYSDVNKFKQIWNNILNGEIAQVNNDDVGNKIFGNPNDQYSTQVTQNVQKTFDEQETPSSDDVIRHIMSKIQ